MSDFAAGSSRPSVSPNPYVVLSGNPNCGKTTLFNTLTGLRAKVGNYAGVTVERKEGRLLRAPADANIRVLDLPGTYSLSPNSLDEQISRDVLLNRLPELPAPNLIVVVVDVAETNGHQIDEKRLSETLGVPVLPVVASTGRGLAELRAKIVAFIQHP